MNAFLLLSLIIVLLTGFFIMDIFLPRFEKVIDYSLLRITFGAGIGFGISSCLYFIYMLIYGSPIKPFLVLETAILAFLFLIKTGNAPMRHIDVEELPKSQKFLNILPLGFFGALLLALAASIYESLILPHGGWDAWQTWNFFARFFFRGGAHWTDAFSTLLTLHHPDYPLLLPMSIARCWQYIGFETQVVPALIALVFTFASIGLLYSSLSVLKGRSQGFFGGIVLLGTTNFIILGTMQYADVPLGFFFLATLALLFLQGRFPKYHRISFLAGVMLGLAGWMKNEGLLFVVSVCIALIVTSTSIRSSIRQLIFFTTGLIPVLSIVLYFKVTLAPPNDLVSAQGMQTLDKLLEIDRYWQILKSFPIIAINTIPLLGFMVFYLVFIGIRVQEEDRKALLQSLIVLGMTLVGYFMTYVITHNDLAWHLSTSLSRLFLQLWPSFIFVGFMIGRTPEDLMEEKHLC